VYQFEVALFGLPNGHAYELFQVSAGLEPLQHGAQPLRAFRMPLSGIMLEKNIVVQKGRLHHGNPREFASKH